MYLFDFVSFSIGGNLFLCSLICYDDIDIIVHKVFFCAVYSLLFILLLLFITKKDICEVSNDSLFAAIECMLHQEGGNL